MDIFKDIYKISKLYVNFPLQDIFILDRVDVPFLATFAPLLATIF